MSKSFEKIKIKKILLPANVQMLSTAIIWLEKICDEINITQKNKIKLCLATEEIFVNIAKYAYISKNGDVEISCMVNKNEISIQFIDSGTKYNPLQKADPDITLNVEERPIGGLGIYMVKQSMDATNYEYKNGKNILILKCRY